VEAYINEPVCAEKAVAQLLNLMGSSASSTETA